MPARIASAGLRTAIGLPSIAMTPESMSRTPKESLGQFGAPGPHQPRHADDLAGLDGEIDAELLSPPSARLARE